MCVSVITDIDECREGSPCQQGCVNIVGSYACTCNSGYQLAADGRTCEGTFDLLKDTYCTNNVPYIAKFSHGFNFRSVRYLPESGKIKHSEK